MRGSLTQEEMSNMMNGDYRMFDEPVYESHDSQSNSIQSLRPDNNVDRHEINLVRQNLDELKEFVLGNRENINKLSTETVQLFKDADLLRVDAMGRVSSNGLKVSRDINNAKKLAARNFDDLFVLRNKIRSNEQEIQENVNNNDMGYVLDELETVKNIQNEMQNVTNQQIGNKIIEMKSNYNDKLNQLNEEMKEMKHLLAQIQQEKAANNENNENNKNNQSEINKYYNLVRNRNSLKWICELFNNWKEYTVKSQNKYYVDFGAVFGKKVEPLSTEMISVANIFEKRELGKDGKKIYFRYLWARNIKKIAFMTPNKMRTNPGYIYGNGDVKADRDIYKYYESDIPGLDVEFYSIYLDQKKLHLTRGLIRDEQWRNGMKYCGFIALQRQTIEIQNSNNHNRIEEDDIDMNINGDVNIDADMEMDVDDNGQIDLNGNGDIDSIQITAVN